MLGSTSIATVVLYKLSIPSEKNGHEYSPMNLNLLAALNDHTMNRYIVWHFPCSRLAEIIEIAARIVDCRLFQWFVRLFVLLFNVLQIVKRP